MRAGAPGIVVFASCGGASLEAPAQVEPAPVTARSCGVVITRDGDHFQVVDFPP